MDSSEFSAGSGRPSPRRELQGPRPTPLKVRKDSYKVKKPPIVPSAQPPPQHRPPVIIYTVSPKVIHTNPSDFMSLVQRLTGASSSSKPPTIPSPSAGRSLSPAAQFATIEKLAQACDGDQRLHRGGNDLFDQLGIDGGATLDRPGSFPAGILSPVPTSLPMISPNFFSPPAVDTNNSLGFWQEMSPAFHGNKSFVDNTFLVSPSNLLSTPVVSSPGAYWDLFNQFQDL